MAKEVLNKIDIETADHRERRKLIMQLTWPALGENLLSTLVSLADSAMVATLGTYAITAVGLVTQPRFIVFSAFMALGIGTTALIARAKGKNQQQHNEHNREHRDCDGLPCKLKLPLLLRTCCHSGSSA